MNPNLTCNDRSFLYGDGIFTTIQVKERKLSLWPLHVKRLQQGVNMLRLGDVDWSQLYRNTSEAISASSQVIKILISRGQGGRGYGTTAIAGPSVYITCSTMPDYSQWRQQGITLGIAEFRLGIQPALAGLKHNNRLEQVLIKQELQTTDWDDLLVFDQMGYVSEASAANVFFFRNGSWSTPEITTSGVNGVMRQHILHTQPEIAEVRWMEQELADIEAMCLTNALMELVPVRQFNGRALSLAPVHQLARQVVC